MDTKNVQWPDLSAHGLTLLYVKGSPRSFVLAPVRRDSIVEAPDFISSFFEYDDKENLWIAKPKDGQPVRFPSLRVWMQHFPACVLRPVSLFEPKNGLQSTSVRYPSLESIAQSPLRATWIWQVNIEENDARDVRFFTNEIEAQGHHPQAVVRLVDAEDVSDEMLYSLETTKPLVMFDDEEFRDNEDDEDSKVNNEGDESKNEGGAGKRHDAGRFVPGNHKDRYIHSLSSPSEFIEMNLSNGFIPMRTLKERFKTGRIADILDSVDSSQSPARKKFIDFMGTMFAPSLLSAQGFRVLASQRIRKITFKNLGVTDDFTDQRGAETLIKFHENYMQALVRIEDLANMIPDGEEVIPFEVTTSVLFDPLFNNGRDFMTKAQTKTSLHGDFLANFIAFAIGRKTYASAFGDEDRKNVYHSIESLVSSPSNHWMIENMNAFMHEHAPEMSYGKTIHPYTVALFMTAFLPNYDIDPIIQSGLSTEDKIRYNKFIGSYIFDDVTSLIGVTTAMILGDNIQEQYKKESDPINLSTHIVRDLTNIKKVFSFNENQDEKRTTTRHVTQLARDVGILISDIAHAAVERLAHQDVQPEPQTKDGEPLIEDENIELSFDMSMLQNMSDLIEQDTRYEKTFKNIRALYEINRKGDPAARGDRHISESEFMDTFGLSAVVYGNSMPEKERQEHINLTYDTLMDMSMALNIPPKAMSLPQKMPDGSYRPLAIAFASRGRGKAAAHYESAQHVINLTRKAGAGFLAHEWGHAFISCALASQTHGRIHVLRDMAGGLDYDMNRIMQVIYSKTMQAHILSDLGLHPHEINDVDFENQKNAMVIGSQMMSHLNYMFNNKTLDAFKFQVKYEVERKRIKDYEQEHQKNITHEEAVKITKESAGAARKIVNEVNPMLLHFYASAFDDALNNPEKMNHNLVDEVFVRSAYQVKPFLRKTVLALNTDLFAWNVVRVWLMKDEPSKTLKMETSMNASGDLLFKDVVERIRDINHDAKEGNLSKENAEQKSLSLFSEIKSHLRPQAAYQINQDMRMTSLPLLNIMSDPDLKGHLINEAIHPHGGEEKFTAIGAFIKSMPKLFFNKVVRASYGHQKDSVSVSLKRRMAKASGYSDPSSMVEGAYLADLRRSKPYWLTPDEMFARTMESVMADLLSRHNISNGYAVIPEIIQNNVYPQENDVMASTHVIAPYVKRTLETILDQRDAMDFSMK